MRSANLKNKIIQYVYVTEYFTPRKYLTSVSAHANFALHARNLRLHFSDRVFNIRPLVTITVPEKFCVFCLTAENFFVGA
jgi:hypothetical protein